MVSVSPELVQFIMPYLTELLM